MEGFYLGINADRSESSRYNYRLITHAGDARGIGKAGFSRQGMNFVALSESEW